MPMGFVLWLTVGAFREADALSRYVTLCSEYFFLCRCENTHAGGKVFA